jgi:hypothetical protein
MHTHTYSHRRHPEFVVLDIGDGVGALIIHTDPVMHGREIEISPTGDDEHRAHKEVLERESAGHPAFTAVFDTLPAGSYTLWSAGRPLARGVGVEGGGVTELDWRDAVVTGGGA